MLLFYENVGERSGSYHIEFETWIERFIFIRCTRRALENQILQAFIKYYNFKFAFKDFDTDCSYYGKWYTIHALKLFRWYIYHRWCVERYLSRKGILIIEAGDYYVNWKFNWNWRWYNQR